MRQGSTLLMAVAFFLPPVIYSQKANVGITAGATLSNGRISASGISITSDNKIGLTAGAFADVPIAELFSFQPALNFVQKGGKSEVSDIDYESKLTLNYVEVPFNFLFKPKMQNVQFFAGAGPSIAVALSGKEKEKDNGGTQTYKYKFGNNPDEHDMKRTDFGANFITGIETKTGIIVAINYNMSLSNVAPGDSDDGTLKNRYWGFKIGYIFKAKK